MGQTNNAHLHLDCRPHPNRHRPSEVGVTDLERGAGEGLLEALGVVDLSVV